MGQGVLTPYYNFDNLASFLLGFAIILLVLDVNQLTNSQLLRKVFRTHDDIEADKADQAIRNSIISIIKKREEKVMKGEEKSFGSDYLGSLMKAHHDVDESKRISIDQMIDECKAFYNGGQETSNSLLAWIIFLLATHLDWQEQARDEVLELFGHENPNPEGLAKLKKMGWIINETLRLYGPVPSLARRANREVKLGNLTIPAEMEVHIPIMALHHNPEIWGKDWHLFKPERFEEGVARATNNNVVAFSPFGFGPRLCVGFNFTINEAKIAISMILQRYRLTLSPTYTHSPIHIFALQPQFGIQVVLNPIVN